jgi:hypothetical protein
MREEQQQRTPRDTAMTSSLEKALAEVAKLPEAEQDALAQWILEQLESERLWDESFVGTQDVLAQWADEALAEHRAGKTRPLDPDTP